MAGVRTVPAWGLASSIAAPVLLIGGWTLAAWLRRDGFDSVSDTISALAARDAGHRWIMTSGFAGVGLAHLITALALRPAAWAGRLVLALGGVATVGVAAAPQPGGGGSSAAHTALATIAFVSLAIWPALSALRMPSGRSAAFRSPVGWAVTVVLLAELIWFFLQLRSGGSLLGLSERLAAGSQALWPLAAVLLSRRRSPVLLVAEGHSDESGEGSR